MVDITITDDDAPQTDDPAIPAAQGYAIAKDGTPLEIDVPGGTSEVVIRIKKPSTFNHIEAWFKPFGLDEFYAQDFSRNASGTICNVWSCATVKEGGVLRLNVPESDSVRKFIKEDIDIAVTIIL